MRKLLLFFFLINLTYSATHYCSPSGSASWANSTNISTPCSWSTAFSNATAGDKVYFRGGDYNLGSAEVASSNNGTANDDAHRIIFKSYPGEMANLYGTTTHGPLIWVDGNYQTYDSLSMHVTINNAGNGDRAVLDAGDWHSAQYVKILSCHLHIVSTATLDNVDCIILEGVSYSDYALIQYCDLEGPAAGNGPGGVIIMTVGSAKGTKILNNEIHNTGVGLYCKHINGDTGFGTGAEWAYNYIHDIGTSNDGGFLGIPAYINIHDNLIINTTGTDFGINGGGSNGTNSLLNHNTFEGGWFRAMDESGGMINYTIKNNIFLNREIYGGSGNTFDYNMWENTSGIGAHDQGSTHPTYVGGSSPSTIVGYALTPASAGYQDGDDSADLGCNTALVGRAPGGGDVTPPVAANSFIATAVDSSAINIKLTQIPEWYRGVGRYQVSSYPTSTTDGISLFDTQDSTTVNNDNFTVNLICNTTYYVTAFLLDSFGNCITYANANKDTLKTSACYSAPIIGGKINVGGTGKSSGGGTGKIQ